MRRKRSSCLPTLLLLITGGLCLLALAAGAALFLLPAYTLQTYGPPSPRLDAVERAYLSARLLFQANSLTRSHDPGGNPQPFEINLGEPTFDITERLRAEGLISDADALRTYLRYSGLDTTLQAGTYTLSPRMTPIEIVQALQDPTPMEVTFAILPGWRLEEIAAALPTSGLSISPEAFLSAASRAEGTPLTAELPPEATLEGFLFPDSYRIPRQATADELVATFLSNFDQKVDDDLRAGFERQELSLFQAVTLASIVERESVVDEEMTLIASVFLNRLAAGIKLDSDPTVQYALGFDAARNTWWTNPLSLDDLQADSPYNTYRFSGLPPGPIANPSLGALRAVAFPAQTPYYYFRASCDNTGQHVFAETFEEHLKNECP